MKRRYLTLAVALFLSQGIGCALQRPSPWKIQGGPKECMDTCRLWDLEFVAMVAVGDQGRTSEGASACVCQLRKSPAASAEVLGAAAAAASMAAPISAAQAAAADAEAGGP